MKKPEKIYMYGKNALKEALFANPKSIKKIYLSANVDSAIKSLIEEKSIPTSSLKEGMVGKETPHQGVVAVIDQNNLTLDLETFLKNIKISSSTCLVLLDEIQDPHNVGAIIRSAAAFGASGILMPEHNQAPITGAVIKSSAGMVFRLPIVKIGNVNQTLRTLKDKGFWIYGLAIEGAKNIVEEKFDSPTVFVIGNEGEGIREKTLELCDVTLKIEMHPRTESLNAAVSSAIVLYEWSKQHDSVLG